MENEYISKYPSDIVEAVVLYFFNIDPLDQLETLIGHTSPTYQAEWCQRYKDFCKYWGSMDIRNKDKYTAIALAKYKEEVQRKRELSEAT